MAPTLADLLAGRPEDVAPRLLGALVRCGGVVVRLTEVEAYAGSDDPGSYAYRGRTPRTATMFGPAGGLYCYLSYGMHVCANVVVDEPGVAGAVLLRAGEVVGGVDTARARRGRSSDRDLARGPGRLGQALGLGLHHDGTDLAVGPVTLDLPPSGDATTVPIAAGPRVGLRGAPDRSWRFWIEGERTVSAYRRHPRAAPDPA